MTANERSMIVMSDDEVSTFIAQHRTATLATIGKDGRPHLVAMWYAWLDGEIWFETKMKSQKAVNVRRDPRVTVSLEDGWTYDTLRGIAIDGTAEIVDDPDTIWRVGVDVWERYNGPYTDEIKPFVEAMMRKRVALRLVPERIRSWDHTKLGLGGMDPSGSTAEFLPRR